MSQEYINSLYGEYSSQRSTMLHASLEAANRYDRAVLAITTGAMALSLTFLEKVVVNPDQRTIPLIIAAWTFLLVALIAELLALSSSQKACQHQIEILDEEYEPYLYSDDPGEAVTNRLPPTENVFSKRTHRYSAVALWSLIFGIIFLMSFSATNLYLKGDRNGKGRRPEQEERQHGGQGHKGKLQGKLHAREEQATSSAPKETAPKEKVESNE